MVIGDKDPIARRALSLILSREGHQVVGRASNGSEIIRLISKELPSLLILDINIEAPEGLTLLRQLSRNYPQVKILVISSLDSDVYSMRCMRLGVRGYLNKGMEMEFLPLMLRGLHDGSLLFPAIVNRRQELESLTDRELVALRCLACGASEGGVANALMVTGGGAQAICRRLRERLGFSNGESLREFGQRLGLGRPSW